MESADVPPEILTRLRAVCLGLPETYEEPAWVGVRWRVRQRTVAHVLTVQEGWPPAYASAADDDGPTTMVTFRAPVEEAAALGESGHPFFRPRWAPDVVGLVFDDQVDRVDWDEVAELLTESYCVLAPRKLVRLVDRPSA